MLNGETGAIDYEIRTEADFNAVQFLSQYKLTTDPANPEYRFSCEVELSDETGRVNKVTITNKGQVPIT